MEPHAYDNLSREHSITESNPGRHCRICLEPEGELIIPCECKTNPVHRNCLNQWRAEEKQGNNFERCEMCHFRYEIEQIPAPPLFRSQYAWYGASILWVIFKALVILVGGISFWGVVCGYLDRDRALLHVFNLSPGKSYLLWGVVFFFLTVDLYGIYCMLKQDHGGCGGNICPDCIILDCGGGEAACALAIICVVVGVVTGILIGLYFVFRDIEEASKAHLRILNNYAQVDSSRVMDRSSLFASQI